MSPRARIGIIGAGWWAVANHIPALKAIPECQIVAVNRLGSRELAKIQRAFSSLVRRSGKLSFPTVGTSSRGPPRRGVLLRALGASNTLSSRWRTRSTTFSPECR